MRTESRYDDADRIGKSKTEYKDDIADIQKDIREGVTEQDQFTLVTQDTVYPYKIMQETLRDILGSVTFVENDGQVSVRSTGNQLILMQRIMTGAHLRYLATDGPADQDGKAIVASMRGAPRSLELVQSVRERLERRNVLMDNPSLDPERFTPCLTRELFVVKEVLATM